MAVSSSENFLFKSIYDIDIDIDIDILRLCRFGCEMPTLAILGEFWGILTP